MSEAKVCGRSYQVVSPRICHERDRKWASTRVLVDGIAKANGDPIRFKSVERAQRHLINMRLEKSS